MDRIVEKSLLFDFYGELLTQHQKEVYGEYIQNDLSPTEIAVLRGISRQGAYDLIKRCEKILTDYENRLHLVEHFQKVKKTVAEYSKAYYPIVETYIWNIMMKKNIRFMDNPDLDIEITDWLLKNDEFKKIAKFPDDKRIVCKIVHECFFMIERKSERLSYCWSEFTVK